MAWLQLRVNCSRESAPNCEKALETCNALAVTLEDNANQPIFEPELGETPLWQETRVTGLFHADIDTEALLQKVADELKLPIENLHWHILEDKDWEREWMQHYHPIQCSDQFWICPSWTAPPDPNACNLLLDPGLAFGTGTHPTTFLSLQWIAEQAELTPDYYQQKVIIDYGCGSGILGIATLLLGAPLVSGVDIDPQALIATRENVQRNNIEQEHFPVFLPNKFNSPLADILLANILAGPLVELAPAFANLLNTGGKLCLSGILTTQKEAIVSAYEEAFVIDETREKDGWICVLATKK